MVLFLKNGLCSVQVTTEKIPAYRREPYTLEYAGYYIIDTHYSSYYHIWKYSVRKLRKFPGVFICRFLTHIDGWHRKQTSHPQRDFLQIVEGRILDFENPENRFPAGPFIYNSVSLENRATDTRLSGVSKYNFDCPCKGNLRCRSPPPLRFDF